MKWEGLFDADADADAAAAADGTVVMEVVVGSWNTDNVNDDFVSLLLATFPVGVFWREFDLCYNTSLDFELETSYALQIVAIPLNVTTNANEGYIFRYAAPPYKQHSHWDFHVI